jgi:hypothetical protein
MVVRLRAVWLGLAVIVAGGWSGPASGDPIVYIEQAIATGTVGQYDFIDTLVTISLTADTGDVRQTPGGLLYNAGQGSLSVAGVGTGSFLDPLTAFTYASTAGTLIGITDTNRAVSADLLDTALPGDVPYDLSTFLAPVTGASLISPNATFATTFGDLNLFLAPPGRAARRQPRLLAPPRGPKRRPMPPNPPRR